MDTLAGKSPSKAATPVAGAIHWKLAWPLLSVTRPTPPRRRSGRSAVAGCATIVKVVAWTTAATVVQASDADPPSARHGSSSESGASSARRASFA